MRIALVILGVVFELAGILLVGAADVMPGVRRRAAQIAARLDQVWRWIRRVVLRRPKHVAHYASAGGAIAVGGHVSAVTSTSATDVEGKIEYLLRESERTQRRLTELERSAEDRHEEIKSELARLNRELVDHVDRAITTALAEYASARRLGIVCLGVAMALWAIAAVV